VSGSGGVAFLVPLRSEAMHCGNRCASTEINPFRGAFFVTRKTAMPIPGALFAWSLRDWPSAPLQATTCRTPLIKGGCAPLSRSAYPKTCARLAASLSRCTRPRYTLAAARCQ
jgi:hypothetical protein